MKRTVSVLLALSMVLALGACKDNSNNSNDSIESSTENTSVVTDAAPIKIVNHMTEEELSRVNTHALTLLDKPEIKDPMEQFNNSEHTLQIEFKTYTKEYLLSSIEAVKDQMPEEVIENSKDIINASQIFVECLPWANHWSNCPGFKYIKKAICALKEHGVYLPSVSINILFLSKRPAFGPPR